MNFYCLIVSTVSSVGACVICAAANIGSFSSAAVDSSVAHGVSHEEGFALHPQEDDSFFENGFQHAGRVTKDNKLTTKRSTCITHPLLMELKIFQNIRLKHDKNKYCSRRNTFFEVPS